MGITILSDEEIVNQLNALKSSEEKEEVYRLFKAMTPSMQKAIVDIMKTVNGEEIDDRANDIQ